MRTQKKILFVSPYPFDKAPSQRLKYEQYFPAIREDGYLIRSDSFISEKLWTILYKKEHFIFKAYLTFLAYLKRYFLLFSVTRYDIIYVHLWGTPFGTTVFERLLRVFSKKLVYDIDDLVFLRDTNEANKFLKRFKGKSKSIYLMKCADHVITCTPRLDVFVKKYNHHTTDISSTVDTKIRYQQRSSYQKKDKFILGWSGSYTTSKYLYLLSDVLKNLSKKFDFKLIVMGDKEFKIDGVNIEAIEWNEKTEVETLLKFDVGLYPLPDEEWVYGKSGLKAIQYMALGIPTIATGIGANFRIIKDGENGFLINPDNYADWEIRIEQLLQDECLRKQLGAAARNTIVKNYSLDSNKQKYLNILNSLTLKNQHYK